MSLYFETKTTSYSFIVIHFSHWIHVYIGASEYVYLRYKYSFRLHVFVFSRDIAFINICKSNICSRGKYITFEWFKHANSYVIDAFRKWYAHRLFSRWKCRFWNIAWILIESTRLQMSFTSFSMFMMELNGERNTFWI